MSPEYKISPEEIELKAAAIKLHVQNAQALIEYRPSILTRLKFLPLIFFGIAGFEGLIQGEMRAELRAAERIEKDLISIK